MFPMQGNTESTSATLYVDDVFSAYTYTGNGGTQNIVNGIDLAGKGGMIWSKRRTGSGNHQIQDSAIGITNVRYTDSTAGDSTSSPAATSFNANGFTLGTNTYYNNSSFDQVTWTFRKAPKFFDVVTYTGNGVAGRAIPHSLGVKPGMMIVKMTSGAKDWYVWHKNLTTETNRYLVLNSTAAEAAYNLWQTAPDATNFYLANTTDCNGAGSTYVAYLFAHDPSADGIIQCGSFTTDGSNSFVDVTLGWEPQYVLYKRSDSSANGDWRVVDVSRGMTLANDAVLNPNLNSAESSVNAITPLATGFTANSLSVLATYIYLAIRRPNKPPTVGTQVYNAIARTGTGAAATVTGVGFAPDLVHVKARNQAYSNPWSDRLRSSKLTLFSEVGIAEVDYATSGVTLFNMDGISTGGHNIVNASSVTYINHFFKRAPGVFDQVCYTGTGVAKTEAHNLGVVPELMIVKSRGSTSHWAVYSIDATKTLILNLTNAFTTSSTRWNNTAPTSTVFTVGTAGGDTNESGQAHVAYLFASKAGISKVGSYTGNGSTQTINCGFTTGARFVLIKRTDSTGDWFVWDTARNIIEGNDPHLSLNTTAAEVTTDDSVDPATSGFIVNQVAATNINVNAATYIFLSFA